MSAKQAKRGPKKAKKSAAKAGKRPAKAKLSAQTAPSPVQAVRDDYFNEQKVLLTWRTRMDTTTEVSEIPPESKMSAEYKQGWKIYLNLVLEISNKMIDLCDAAIANNGDTTELKQKLQNEVTSYGELADEARARGLIELAGMLAWEAKSRTQIIDEL